MVSGFDPSWGREFTGREGSESDFKPTFWHWMTYAMIWLGLLGTAATALGFMFRVGWRLATALFG